MQNTFPGTTVEITKLEQGSSRVLFDGIFATGGVTLSQVCIITGLEYYMIQNWVKRKYVSPPVKRVYSRAQLARIIIINMLRESLNIERIANLIKVIGGVLDDDSDDLISDDELYHRYVDMVADEGVALTNEASVRAAARKAVEDYPESPTDSKEKLTRIIEAMYYAHSAAKLRDAADAILASLE